MPFSSSVVAVSIPGNFVSVIRAGMQISCRCRTFLRIGERASTPAVMAVTLPVCASLLDWLENCASGAGKLCVGAIGRKVVLCRNREPQAGTSPRRMAAFWMYISVSARLRTSISDSPGCHSATPMAAAIGTLSRWPSDSTS